MPGQGLRRLPFDGLCPVGVDRDGAVPGNDPVGLAGASGGWQGGSCRGREHHDIVGRGQGVVDRLGGDHRLAHDHPQRHDDPDVVIVQRGLAIIQGHIADQVLARRRDGDIGRAAGQDRAEVGPFIQGDGPGIVHFHADVLRALDREAGEVQGLGGDQRDRRLGMEHTAIELHQVAGSIGHDQRERQDLLPVAPDRVAVREFVLAVVIADLLRRLPARRNPPRPG